MTVRLVSPERHVLLELGCGVAVVATAYVLVVPLVESSCLRDIGLGGETTPGTLWPMVVAHNTVDWRRGIHTGLLLTRRPTMRQHYVLAGHRLKK